MDERYLQSIELSFEEIQGVMEKVGFVMDEVQRFCSAVHGQCVGERRRVKCRRSMMTTLFRGVLFVAHKGEWWCLFEICSQLLATLGGDITDGITLFIGNRGRKHGMILVSPLCARLPKRVLGEIILLSLSWNFLATRHTGGTHSPLVIRSRTYSFAIPAMEIASRRWTL